MNPPCPLCGAADSRPFDTRTFRGRTIHNRICATCGLVYQSPRMSEAELADFYAAEYRRMYQGDEGPSPKDLRTQEGRATALLEFVADSVPEVSRHLDIGCSAGLLLERFRDRYACQPRGVEPGDAYRAYARSRGLTVYPALDDLTAAEEPPFDLISMAHVLEHLPDPVHYLAALRERHLTPGGHLLIEVPNLYCHDSFEVAHLVSFSAHTLRQTLEQAGFRVLKLQKHGRPRSAILPLYLTVLAQPSQSSTFNLQPETFVPLKRRAGMFCRRVAQKLFPGKAWLS